MYPENKIIEPEKLYFSTSIQQIESVILFFHSFFEPFVEFLNILHGHFFFVVSRFTFSHKQCFVLILIENLLVMIDCHII